MARFGEGDAAGGFGADAVGVVGIGLHGVEFFQAGVEEALVVAPHAGEEDEAGGLVADEAPVPVALRYSELAAFGADVAEEDDVVRDSSLSSNSSR